MLACDRDEITGLTANHYLHLAKSRDAPEGPIAAIHAEAVQIGSRADGSPITTLVLDFDASGRLPAKKVRLTKTDKPFREAFDAALADGGEFVRVRGEHGAPEVHAVHVEDLRVEFAARYVTVQSDPIKRADNVRNALKSAMKKATESGDFCTGVWASTEWIWKPNQSTD